MNTRQVPRRIFARHGVSLVEVLIVIGIFALLLAMLLPSVRHAREKLRRIQCANNLGQFGKAELMYRQDFLDYLPMEGSGGESTNPGAWYNTLPKYLGFPPYKDIERIDKQIKEFPALHVWICPSKQRTPAFRTEQNQYHYGMNAVLDGLGSKRSPSKDTPDFHDLDNRPLRASQFRNYSNTVFMFDISPNSPCGTPRDVATMYQRDWRGARPGEFHGDYANLVYLDGRVSNCTTDELVTDHDFRHGDIIWDLPKLYWGWKPRR